MPRESWRSGARQPVRRLTNECRRPAGEDGVFLCRGHVLGLFRQKDHGTNDVPWLPASLPIHPVTSFSGNQKQSESKHFFDLKQTDTRVYFLQFLNTRRENVLKVEWQVTRWPVLMLMAAVFGMGPATVWAGTNVWTSTGPEGGSIQALAIDPQNSSTVYAVAGGGIFKSTDATANWRRVYPAATRDGTAAYPASVLVIDPQNTNMLYAGTGGSPTTVDGSIFKSTDGGANWSAANSGLPTPSSGTYRTAKALAVDPRNPDVAYVGFVIQCVAPVPCISGGMFKTTDGGASWNAVNSGLPDFGVTALLIDPQNTNTIYAGTVANSTLTVPPSSDGGKGIPITNDGGVFKSTDGAATWTAVNVGLPRSYWYDRPTQYKPINALAMAPQHSSMLYAATGGGGISQTTDGGATWVGGKIGLLVNALAIDPQNPSTIYAGTTNFGLLKSTDGGASFSNVSTGLPDNPSGAVNVLFLAMDRHNPSALYAGSQLNQNGLTTFGGTFKSTDGAENWNPVSTSGLVATSVNSLAIDTKNSGTLYAAAGGRVFKSTESGANWKEVYSAPPTDDGRSIYPASVVATDPQVPGTIYVGIGDNSDGGGGVFKSEDGGASWTRFRLPRGGGVRGLAVDPQNPGTIYAWIGVGWYCPLCPINSNSGSGLFKSSDGAASWTELKSLAPFGAVTNLWIDPQNSATLYAQTYRGINPGTLAKSTDGGASWSAVTPTLPSFSGEDYQAVSVTVSSLAIDPQDSNTVCAISAHDGVFKSTDGAATWSAANFSLPSDSSGSVRVSLLVFDPQNSSKLYARTSSGVFRSTDGGASWTAVNAGLTNRFVNMLAIDPHDSSTVYAGTAGGGVFAITLAP
jgi:photosystem II stability/assembly factor-like uncharacterized protein